VVPVEEVEVEDDGGHDAAAQGPQAGVQVPVEEAEDEEDGDAHGDTQAGRPQGEEHPAGGPRLRHRGSGRFEWLYC